MFGIFGKREGANSRRGNDVAAVPDGVRLYVVGDIHGRADLLRELHDLIEADASDRPASTSPLLVYLGDYIDRGPGSRDVIDTLISDSFPDFERIFLKGNHDDSLLQFLEGPAAGSGWFGMGGLQTLLSYGVSVPSGVATAERLEEVQRRLIAALPKAHLDFLSRLELSYEAGDYFFAHAGILPNRSLARQDPEDFLWGDNTFLRSDKAHEKVIVHGHFVSSEPDVRANRIGIDTGAYFSNLLTCLVLEGQSRRFLQTK
jgi:serine/threonine protein phosphatase 1